MIHAKRTYNIYRLRFIHELAEHVTRRTWSLCTGFELDGYVFLNDSFTEDSAQEYAVIKNGRQVESITFSWCTRAIARQHIRDILTGKHVDMGEAKPHLDHPKGTCQLCA